jgi:hypothetical protein
MKWFENIDEQCTGLEELAGWVSIISKAFEETGNPTMRDRMAGMELSLIETSKSIRKSVATHIKDGKCCG